MNQETRQVPLTALRLISLFLALGLWVMFSGRTQRNETIQIQRRGFQLPIIQQGIASDMEFTSDVYRIFVSLSGTQEELAQIQEGSLSLVVPLDDYGPGTHQVPIPDEWIRLPVELSSLKVEYIQPRVLRINLVEKIRKPVEVILRLTGNPDPRFLLKSSKVTPPLAELVGPKTQLEALTLLLSEPVDISGATQTLEGRVAFDYNQHVPPNCVISNAQDIRYRIEIEEKTDAKSLGSLSVPLTEGLQSQPSEVTITISGPASAVQAVRKEWIILSFDPAFIPTSDPQEVTLLMTLDLNAATAAEGQPLEGKLRSALSRCRLSATPSTVTVVKP
jgi:YbbR domain-containing protein